MLIKQFGGLLILLGFVIAIPVPVSFIYGEYYSAAGFAISSIVIILFGELLYKKIKVKTEPLQRHAMLIAASGWMLMAIVGAIPFVLISYITPAEVAQSFVPAGSDYTSSLFCFRDPLNAVFEAMSAFTTTGYTMVVHEPSIGKGLLFYRSVAAWIGGAGFIVLLLAVFKQSSGRSAALLFGAESTSDRLRPTIIETTRSIWKIYAGVTIFVILSLIIGTYIILPDYPLSENIFDSINHTFVGLSTAGFSTLDDSIAGYNSKAMEILYLLPMVLGAFSFPFYFRLLYEKQINQFWKNIQTRAIILTCIFGSIILAFFLWRSSVAVEPGRTAVFQYVSALSTTGWQTCDINAWDSLSALFVVLAMIVGGAAASTVGGVKIIRVLLLFKGLKWQVNNYFLSNGSVKVADFNQKRFLPEQFNKELASAATFCFIYLVILIGFTIISSFFITGNYSLIDILFESASAQGTVGLSTGITQPDMSPVVKIIYTLQMWLGRLEIIPILILFRTIIVGNKPRIS